MATSAKNKTTAARSATVQKATAEVVSDEYEVEESDADLPENQFRFRWGDDHYSVPKFAYVKPTLAAEVDIDNMVGTMLLLVEAYYPGLGDRFKDGTQLGKLFLAWAAASGIELGE